jgi:hypothetical protein
MPIIRTLFSPPHFCGVGLNAQTNLAYTKARIDKSHSSNCSPLRVAAVATETWLSALKHSPRLWQEFVPLAFMWIIGITWVGGIHGHLRISLTVNAPTQNRGEAVLFIPLVLC